MHLCGGGPLDGVVRESSEEVTSELRSEIWGVSCSENWEKNFLGQC